MSRSQWVKLADNSTSDDDDDDDDEQGEDIKEECDAK